MRKLWKPALFALAAVGAVVWMGVVLRFWREVAHVEHEAIEAARTLLVGSYGHIETTVDGRPEVLPLRHTAVEAEVVGVMSTVRLTQRFENPFAKPLDATYVFPLPPRAAVYAMTLRVGDRTIVAEVRKREEARAVFDEAKRAGKTAALLDQERPNVFTQSVANIRPGERVEVELAYAEELVPKDGRYEFVFPMVVGPRYPAGAPDAARLAAPRPPPDRPGDEIALTLRLRPGVSPTELRTPTHAVLLDDEPGGVTRVALQPADRIANRDFVASWRLTGPSPRAALLATPEGAAHEGHFLLQLQPPAALAEADVAPREYVFVVDTSGSMSGRPLDRAKSLMKRCLDRMRPVDRVQVIRFGSEAQRLFEAPTVASPAVLAQALAFAEEWYAGGGTEFLPALALALDAPRDPARARQVVFITDGFIGNEAEILRHIREHLGGANLFALGVGGSVNRYLIEGMARLGHGEPFVLLDADDTTATIDRLFTTISRPALTDLRIDWGDLPVADVTPARVPDLLADRPVVVAGRFTRPAAGRVRLDGLRAGRPFTIEAVVSFPETAAANDTHTLAELWARRTIDDLTDLLDTGDERDRPALESRITDIALRHHLMTRFTSFVAVDQAGPRALTPEAPRESAALSTDQFIPGDPEVRIQAPPEAERVTLLFPTGEIKPCHRDARTGEWVQSFLIPEDTPDGVYTIRVLITLRDGRALARAVRYRVDGAAPRVIARLDRARVHPGDPVHLTLTVAPGGDSILETESSAEDIGDPTFSARIREEASTVEAELPGGEIRTLARAGEDRFELTFTAPEISGRYLVPVVARDAARNKTRQVVELEVTDD